MTFKLLWCHFEDFMEAFIKCLSRYLPEFSSTTSPSAVIPSYFVQDEIWPLLKDAINDVNSSCCQD